MHQPGLSAQDIGNSTVRPSGRTAR